MRRREELKVDRNKTCPLLLRVFTSSNQSYRPEDFRDALPLDEIQVYTWKDATLRELTDLVKTAKPVARKANARLNFSLVYPDKSGKNVMRSVGTVFSSRRGMDDDKTLDNVRFETGDYLSVTLTVGGGPRAFERGRVDRGDRERDRERDAGSAGVLRREAKEQDRDRSPVRGDKPKDVKDEKDKEKDKKDDEEGEPAGTTEIVSTDAD